MTDAGPDTDRPDDGRLYLRLDGFDGPLDLLLDLARAQKTDLHRISVLQLVDQYLLIVEGARRVRLELAADWLVMAAWLTWLKSRLLLPPDSAGAEEGEEAADSLHARLRELEAVRAAAATLNSRPLLNRDVWARGSEETFAVVDRTGFRLSVSALVGSYLGAVRRAGTARRYAPRVPELWSVVEALERMTRLLGAVPDWSVLEFFVPPDLRNGLHRRAAVASTLIASLEMARSGNLRLRQEQAFGPILLRAGA